MDRNLLDNLPDVRDGLTRKQRIILYCLHQLQAERQGRNVPTVMLYGRVLEFINMGMEEFNVALSVIETRQGTTGQGEVDDCEAGTC